MNTLDQFKMYGMTEETIRKEYMDSITAKLSGFEMVVAGILSDCQEMIAPRPSMKKPDEIYIEWVRQQLNVAKFILFEMSDQKEAA
jgi:hypothetical protein